MSPLPISTQMIPGGDAGVLGATVPRMAALIRMGRIEPLIRGAAVRLVGGCRPTDDLCRQLKIYRFVKRHIRFVPDPRRVELLHTPLAMLYTIRVQGWAAGDCDDSAILLGALMEAVGVRTRIKVVAVEPGDVRPFRHVFIEARQSNGLWLRWDPLGERYPEHLFTRSAVREV